MPNPDRMDEIIKQIFTVLNEKKISPEEGLMIAEEILFSSMERMAKIHNISIEEIQARIAEHFLGGQKDTSKRVFKIGQGHGWIGNPKTLTENN
jgi:hypothetical protein